MSWTVLISGEFWPSVAKLKPNYDSAEFIEVVSEVREALDDLTENGRPTYSGWDDHVLEQPPFSDGSYHEFHIHDDDMLVVYYKRISKTEIRMVGVYDHKTIPGG